MSCCTCNSTPCCCAGQLAPAACCTPTTESVDYTFENGNVIGIGVFDNDTDNLVQFRGIASNSLALTVTLDAPNKAIILDFDGTLLVADIPDATTTQRGILETATNAEAVAKAATDKILTPSNLAALGATETSSGIAEIATAAEVNAGLDDTRFVTSLKLNSWSLTTQQITKVFANAVTRASTAPTFEGQFGAQIDVDSAWVGYSTGLGQWRPLFTGNADNQLQNLFTTLTITGGGLTIEGGTTGQFIVNDCIWSSTNAVLTLVNATTVLGAGSWDWSNTTEVRNSGVAIPANSVLITSATAGIMSSALVNTFLSTANTQVYGLPTSTLNRTTFATYAGQVISNPPTQAEVQALDNAVVIVSQRLGAVITDLMNTVKPHAT